MSKRRVWLLCLVVLVALVVLVGSVSADLPPKEVQLVPFWDWMGWATQDVIPHNDRNQVGIFIGKAIVWEDEVAGNTSTGCVAVLFEPGRYRDVRFYNGALRIWEVVLAQREALFQQEINKLKVYCPTPEVLKFTGEPIPAQAQAMHQEASKEPVVEPAPLVTVPPELGLWAVTPVLEVGADELVLVMSSGFHYQKTYGVDGTRSVDGSYCVLAGFGPGSYPGVAVFNGAIRQLSSLDGSAITASAAENLYRQHIRTLRDLYPDTCGKVLSPVGVNYPADVERIEAETK